MQALSEQDDRVSIESRYRPHLVHGDSTFVKDDCPYTLIQPSSVNLLCVHPPYLDALTYTDAHPDDLSRITEPEEFRRRIAAFALGATAYLSSNKRVRLVDWRRKGETVALSH